MERSIYGLMWTRLYGQIWLKTENAYQLAVKVSDIKSEQNPSNSLGDDTR
jgi:hypothetical protein